MKLDFKKMNGLIPAIVQDAISGQVLMLAYVNEASWAKTLAEGKLCFYSRSKQRLWTKGESSGNFLFLQSYAMDCDQDSLLIQALPAGPVCHTGTATCFGDLETKGFLYRLNDLIQKRKAEDDGYTASLLREGLNKVAQKLGEEATETVVAALAETENDLLNESADLVYHLLVLLRMKGLDLNQLEARLAERHA